MLDQTVARRNSYLIWMMEGPEAGYGRTVGKCMGAIVFELIYQDQYLFQQKGPQLWSHCVALLIMVTFKVRK